MRLNTVTKKTMLLMSGIGIAVLFCINALFPSIFYQVMKPHLIHQISGIVSANALRQSYIWRNNNILNQLQNSDEMKQWILQYYISPEKEEAKEQIIASLPTLRNGIRRSEPIEPGHRGYINSSNYFLLFTSRGDVFYNEQAEPYAKVLLESDWYRTLNKEQELFDHLPLIESSDAGLRIFGMVSSFKAGGIHCFGVNIVDFQDIQAQFDEFQTFHIDDYVIFCKGKILYQNLGTGSGIRLEEYPAAMMEGGQYETMVWTDQDSTHFSVLCTYIKEDYRVAAHVPKDLLLAPYQEAFSYFRLLLGCIVAILLVLFCVTLKGTLNRLTKLERKMNRVRQGDYHISISDKSSDEIGNLTNTFNMMLEKISQDRKKEQQMQYSLMVSAIDPHYLYNTLNTVTALAELGRNEDVIAVNDALIATLKDRLKMKNYKTFDTVKAEREALEQYMVIQNFLWHQTITFTFSVAEEDLTLQIPKNIIQPLVENAIKHGILCNEDEAGQPKPGVISVSVRRQEGHIVIEIADNGVGIDNETKEQFFSLEQAKKRMQDNDMEHIGIYNVQMRLDYLYHGKYEFQVESASGKGTIIRIVLPLQPETL